MKTNRGWMTKATLERWSWLGCVLILLASVSPMQAFYNPSTGRWLSRDPIAEKGGRNLYGFVFNRPVSRYDVLGRESKTFSTYDDYATYQVSVDVAPSPIFGPCTVLPGGLIIPISISTSYYEGRDQDFVKKDVLMTVDGGAVPVTLSSQGGDFVFTSLGSKSLPACPKGPQKGSITIKAQYHDDNYRDQWVTAFTAVISWTYECECHCLGLYEKPFKTKFAWTGNERPR